MRQPFLFLSVLLMSLAVTAQVNYEVTAGRFLHLYNASESDSIFALYSPKVQGLLPLDKNRQMVAQLQQQLGKLRSVELFKRDTGYCNFKASFDNTALTMILALDAQGRIDGLRFAPWQAPAAVSGGTGGGAAMGAAAGDGEGVTLKTGTGDLYGTLVLPLQHSKKIPVVLIIAGSGPTDRNGNAAAMGLNTNIYKILADSLRQRGIASLRYDKRGIGESAGAIKSESALTFEDYVRDAVGYVQLLKTDGRFSKVIILGHSEGSLVGMITAGQAHADGYISAEGAGERIDKILERQLAAQSSSLAAKATVLLDSLAGGHPVQDPGNGLSSLFRASVQPYMISWLQYDPQTEIKKLSIPILLIQGTTDLQTSVRDAELLKKAKPDASLVLIDQMNHIFRQAGMDRQQNITTYNNVNLPLKPEFVREVGKFVLSGEKP